MFFLGPTNSYVVYLQEYHTHIFPTTPTTTLSWIGCLQFGTQSMLAIGAGILVKRFDVRLVVAFGCMLSGVSLLVASACKSPIAPLFTQGFLLGIGGSCIQVPAVSLPGQ
ncbi:hypothetical protein LPJ53_003625 [Coemansia erecta]|uniref:MFS general substrate transporter n=1 Tax=Coemansia erecta TaxID=147472 RepID=A0A9W7Y1N3_9FUNG|nr:hypothetical protein LPJ53_003625 [Coemansia erecta]